jgi:hypothetical protein
MQIMRYSYWLFYANNEVFILAFAIVDEENNSN